MSTNRNVAALLLFLLLTGFAFGLRTLFALRLQQGDNFPAYSSLRADPLGTKALFQAIERVPGAHASRHYRDLDKLRVKERLALFYPGLHASFLTRTPPGAVEEMERLAGNGARIVLSFRPEQEEHRQYTDPDTTCDDPAKRDNGEDENPDTKKGKTREDCRDSAGNASAAERWDLVAAYSPIQKGTDKDSPSASLSHRSEGLPRSIPLHTALYFQTRSPDWRVFYSHEEHPAIMERSFGPGSIVLVADSYILSNEAMRDERHPSLLAWLIGDNPVVVFDEFHLGVSETPGVMLLVREFGMQGFLISLAVLAALFVWQNAVPLIPARPKSTPRRSETVTGKDQLSGLINLLQRNIEPGDLLKVCFREWEKSVLHSSTPMRAKADAIRKIIQSGAPRTDSHNGSVAVYRDIVDVLSERIPK